MKNSQNSSFGLFYTPKITPLVWYYQLFMIIAFECQKLVKKLEKSSILSNFQYFSVFGPYLQKIQIATPPSFFELETPFFQTNYLWGTQFFAPVPILEFPRFDPPLGRKTDFLRCFSAKRGVKKRKFQNRDWCKKLCSP